MNLVVDRITPLDVPAILDISVECGLCLWSAESYLSELVRPDSIALKMANAKEDTIGFAVGRIFDLGDERLTAELTNIGIRKLEQHKGLGSRLLKSFLDNCRSQEVSAVVLEVRVSNVAAISFYEKFGFIETGRRKGFYSNPVEDALTMKLQIGVENAQKFHT